MSPSALALPAPFDVIAPLIVMTVIIGLLITIFVRQRRNEILENLVVQTDCNSRLAFRGTLTVEDYRPGFFLRLSRSTKEARRLQLWYRWFGVGRQAIFDEVAFDHSRGVAELKRKDKRTTASFSDFSAIRMREVPQGRSLTSFWHVELVPHKGTARPFVSSVSGGRQASFEHTAPLVQ